MLAEQIVDALTKERHDQGLTQKDMAKRMGCHPSFVQQFEYKRPGVRVATIERYAKALGVQLEMKITH